MAEPGVVECTLPISDLRHYISDDELERIGQLKIDFVEQLFWAALGLTGGSILPAVDALKKFNTPTDPMDASGLIALLILAVAIAVLIVSGVLVKTRSAGRENLLTAIRGRPRAKVLPVRDDS